MGYSGNVDDVVKVLEFLNAPGLVKKPKITGRSEFLAVTKDRKIFSFIDPTTWVSIEDPYYAIGSGAPYALGAMYNGASPKEAIKAASKFDPYTGNGIKFLEFK